MYKQKYWSGYGKSLASGVKTGLALAKYGQYIYKGVNKARAMRGTIAPSINTTQVVGKAYKKKAYKKRVYSKRGYKKTPLKYSIPSIKKDIRKLQSKAKDGESCMTYRWRGAASKISCIENQQTFSPIVSMGVTTIEIVLSNLLYFDPSNPATLISSNATTGTYDRNYRFESVFTKCLFRNNYQIPCKLTVYVSSLKSDTSISVTSAYSNGLADNPGSALSITSPISYLTDSDHYNDLWKIVKKTTIVLQPGQEYIQTYSLPSFNYDPSVSDSHNLQFQKSFKSYSIDARIEGVLGHDTVQSLEQGYLRASCDLQVDRTFKVIYDSGINLNYIIANDTSTGFTTSNPVCSQQPVADNQAYSTA